MTACADKLLLVHGLIDGELDAAGALAVEEHLKTCDGCHQDYQRLLSLRDRLQTAQLAHTAPDALRARIERSLGGGRDHAEARDAPPPRRSSLPTLAEDSVGGGSRSTRTRSPSPSVNTLAGGGSRTASGIEGGSAGIFNLQQQQQQHPSSSGERERGGGGGGGSERGGGGAFAAGLAGGNNNAPTPPPPLYYSHHPSHHRGQGFSLSPLSHSG